MKGERWEMDRYRAEREYVLGYLLRYFRDYLETNNLKETEYESGQDMSVTDKLFALTKLYFELTKYNTLHVCDIALKSYTIAIRSVIDEMIDKQFKEGKQ